MYHYPSQQHCDTPVHTIDHDNLDLSNFHELAQQARQITVEQLTKSERVQPWNGQEQYGPLSRGYHAVGWELGSSARLGAMTEPIQNGAHTMRMRCTLSRHPSNADSGYVSQPVSCKTEQCDGSSHQVQYVGSVHELCSGDHCDSDRIFPLKARTVASETPANLLSYRGSRKPSMAACRECGRPPKNHSDARKHAETHLKRFRCDAFGCTRKDGFATLNDLERHRKSVHGVRPSVGSPLGYICRACAQQSDGKEKFWPRRDNFKAHIKRKHAQCDEAHLLEISKTHRPDDAVTADIESKSVVSILEKPLDPPCSDHIGSTWQRDQRPSYSPQFGQLPYQDDIAGLFNDSHIKEDPLAAMGSHAFDDEMPYHQHYWPTTLDSVNEGFERTHALPSSFFQNNMPYTSISFTHPENKSVTCESNDNKCDLSYTTPARRGSNSPSHQKQKHAQSSLRSALHNGEHQCPYCPKTKKRECDLKKHIKRHVRPYGCTFPSCTKSFGSRNDWKRHEGSQHVLHEQWKCCRVESPQTGGTVCKRNPFNSQAAMVGHLRDVEHGVTSEREVARECEVGRMGEGGHRAWWCGFCVRMISQPSTPSTLTMPPADGLGPVTVMTTSKDTAAWESRFKHIGDHFDKEGREIGDWVCVERNKKKRYLLGEERKGTSVRARRGWEEDEEDLPTWEPTSEVMSMCGLRLGRGRKEEEEEEEEQEQEQEQDAESVSNYGMM